MANEANKSGDANKAPAADPNTPTPGTAKTVNNEVVNTDGEKIEVNTSVNATPQTNLGAPQADAPNSVGEQDRGLFESKGEPIPSIVVKRFYDDAGALIREGARYAYVPKKSLPYPWPLMRPVDEKQNDALKKQYDDHMKEKNEMLQERADRNTLLDRLRGA